MENGHKNAKTLFAKHKARVAAYGATQTENRDQSAPAPVRKYLPCPGLSTPVNERAYLETACKALG